MEKKLYIRLDDITPDMNWEKFDIIRGIFEKYDVKPIIGVVPDNRDKTLSVNPAREDFWEIVCELQKLGWLIAQHGYQHTYVTKDAGLLGINPFSEFAGLPFCEQKEKILKGQEILHKHGVCAKMFMAPGHTYDKNTLKALKELGFTAVTDGYSNAPYHYMGLDFIPCTLARPKLPDQVDTLCLHINNMRQDDFEELDRFIGKQIGVIGDAAEMMQSKDIVTSSDHIRSRGIGTILEERKNLAVRKLRTFAATNEIIQQYMARTDVEDSAKKKRKRILGLPGLFVHLICHISYK